ncbi:hypothetical protein [Herbiconiux sp. UC225_62]|uniref:hypothetical protein n=1 Tax=Herbiconiux sp. UC225_62 TaxID=3350168 RepID=UPI0036D220A1
MSGYTTPKSASLPTPEPKVPSSKAASRSLAFALFIVLANVVLNTLTMSLVGPGTSPVLAWSLVVIHPLVVLALFALALAFGVLGLRETASGALRGRGRAVAGIVVGGFLLLLSFGTAILDIARTFLA